MQPVKRAGLQAPAHAGEWLSTPALTEVVLCKL